MVAWTIPSPEHLDDHSSDEASKRQLIPARAEQPVLGIQVLPFDLEDGWMRCRWENAKEFVINLWVDQAKFDLLYEGLFKSFQSTEQRSAQLVFAVHWYIARYGSSLKFLMKLWFSSLPLLPHVAPACHWLACAVTDTASKWAIGTLRDIPQASMPSTTGHPIAVASSRWRRED